jgi:hypothetical protein
MACVATSPSEPLSTARSSARPSRSLDLAISPGVVWIRHIRHNPSVEVAMTLTPELKRTIERAGDAPVRVEDLDTHAAYVVIKEDLSGKLREAIPESDFTLHEFEELIPPE